MVYLGPSRGCETCKRRRKKCDEAHPSCMRCIAANRTCGGYEDSTKSVFRQHDMQSHNLSPLTSIARKCSLPVRTADSKRDNDKPKELSDEQVEGFALRAFFYDYCIISTDRSVSQGYLHGLEAKVKAHGLQSNLARACKAVAFASHGIKLERPGLTRNAENLYHELLGFLAKAIGHHNQADPTNLLTIAMLLGLYEIIVANAAHRTTCNAHARGVAAILQVEGSSFDIFGTVLYVRPGSLPATNGVAQIYRLFHTPKSDKTDQSLKDLLLMFNSIWIKAHSPSSGSSVVLHYLPQLKQETIILDQCLAKWQEVQPEIFKPRTVGIIHRDLVLSKIMVGYWPGRIETFFDLYVASVWSTTRMARLLLIDLILGISKTLNDGCNHITEHRNALHQLDDMIASIPYHLSEDLSTFLRQLNGDPSPIAPGKAVGGLLLLYPLYAASNLSIASQPLREYMKECLEWIKTNMGIGQALNLAKSTELDRRSISDGCTIIWAGMLI